VDDSGLGFALIDDGGFEELTRYVFCILFVSYWYVFVAFFVSELCLSLCVEY